jgi:hypothetical protein
MQSEGEETHLTESYSSEMARWSSNEWKASFIGHESVTSLLTDLFHGCFAGR